jgi:hypothetical protein
MSTTPSEGTLSTAPSQSKLSRKQRREVRLAEAAQQAVEGATKLSRKQRQSNRLQPQPIYDYDSEEGSYHSSQDSSFTASPSDSSISSEEESVITKGKTKQVSNPELKTQPVSDPEAWLRTKVLIKP